MLVRSRAPGLLACSKPWMGKSAKLSGVRARRTGGAQTTGGCSDAQAWLPSAFAQSELPMSEKASRWALVELAALGKLLESEAAGVLSDIVAFNTRSWV